MSRLRVAVHDADEAGGSARATARAKASLRAGWLLEQDDYGDSVRLASLLAAGHAHLGLLDLDVRLNYLATHDIVTWLRPSIRR